MKTTNLIHWLDDIFCPFTRDRAPEDYEGPFLLILDGHTSHVSIDVIKTARENNVVLVRLPSHSTHLMQVLDVSFFVPTKKHWCHIIKDLLRTYSKKVNHLRNSLISQLIVCL
jgi:hypothetical protein